MECFKFVISNLEGLNIQKKDLQLKLEDKWILSKLNIAIKMLKKRWKNITQIFQLR